MKELLEFLAEMQEEYEIAKFSIFATAKGFIIHIRVGKHFASQSINVSIIKSEYMKEILRNVTKELCYRINERIKNYGND